MIDTVAATIQPTSRIDVSRFEAGEQVKAVGSASERRNRYWLNGDSDLAPRITYWCDDDVRDVGVLRVEFSVPRLSLAPDMQNYNPGSSNIQTAIVLCDSFLRSRVAHDLPSVNEWIAQRCDYAINWRTSHAAEYIAVLNKLSLRSTNRSEYDDGVMWSSKTRTLKFYRRADDVLRFEVSNFRDGCRRLASWFACRRSVERLARVGASVYCLGYALGSLGLAQDRRIVGGEALLVSRLRDAFGVRNVAIAKHVLWCASTHGTQSFRSLNLVSRGTYYAWRARLLAGGFLLTEGGVTHTLPPLGLPLGAVLENSTIYALPPQDLENFSSSHNILSRKNFWPELAQKLEISAAPVCKYFGNRDCREAAS